MKLSTRGRYGVRAMFDLAFHAGTLPAQIKDISRRQEISPRYLEQIFQELKRAGLLKSVRGPQGGYLLAKKPEHITVADIVLAAEGHLCLVDCDKEQTSKEKPCPLIENCITRNIWAEATRRLLDYFASITLKDLCKEGESIGLKRELDQRLMFYI